jgi:very-short-patch-repair endonuclease
MVFWGMSYDGEMALVAESQHGLITLGQVIGCGATEATAERRVAAGRWLKPHPGVYRFAGAPYSWEHDVMAAVLAADPGAVASHRTAARLWGLDGFTGRIVELSVARGRLPQPAGTILHTSTDLDRSVTTTRFGIPVTSTARTLLDLGAVVDSWRVERAIDCAVGRRLVSLSGLWAELDTLGRRGRRGAGVLRSLLDERGVSGGEPESVLEARMLRLLRTHDLPRPICQYEVRVGALLLGRVDFAYPDLRLAIEVDGYESHSSLTAFNKDRARQNDLVEAGWLILRFTWDDLLHHADQVAARLRRVLVSQTHGFPGFPLQERRGGG